MQALSSFDLSENGIVIEKPREDLGHFFPV